MPEGVILVVGGVAFGSLFFLASHFAARRFFPQRGALFAALLVTWVLPAIAAASIGGDGVLFLGLSLVGTVWFLVGLSKIPAKE